MSAAPVKGNSSDPQVQQSIEIFKRLFVHETLIENSSIKGIKFMYFLDVAKLNSFEGFFTDKQLTDDFLVDFERANHKTSIGTACTGIGITLASILADRARKAPIKLLRSLGLALPFALVSSLYWSSYYSGELTKYYTISDRVNDSFMQQIKKKRTEYCRLHGLDEQAIKTQTLNKKKKQPSPEQPKKPADN